MYDYSNNYTTCAGRILKSIDDPSLVDLNKECQQTFGSDWRPFKLDTNLKIEYLVSYTNYKRDDLDKNFIIFLHSTLNMDLKDSSSYGIIVLKESVWALKNIDYMGEAESQFPFEINRVKIDKSTFMNKIEEVSYTMISEYVDSLVNKNISTTLLTNRKKRNTSPDTDNKNFLLCEKRHLLKNAMPWDSSTQIDYSFDADSNKNQVIYQAPKLNDHYVFPDLTPDTKLLPEFSFYTKVGTPNTHFYQLIKYDRGNSTNGCLPRNATFLDFLSPSTHAAMAIDMEVNSKTELDLVYRILITRPQAHILINKLDPEENHEKAIYKSDYLEEIEEEIDYQGGLGLCKQDIDHKNCKYFVWLNQTEVFETDLSLTTTIVSKVEFGYKDITLFSETQAEEIYTFCESFYYDVCNSGFIKDESNNCINCALTRNYKFNETTEECSCNVGYRGDFCTDINECQENPSICDNQTKNSECLNNDGSFYCVCREGFERKSDDSGRIICRDVDECQFNEHICGLYATCQNKQGNYECTCMEGFDKSSLQPVDTAPQIVCKDKKECLEKIEINGKKVSPCDVEVIYENYDDLTEEQPENICTDLYGGYSCQCIHGYKWDSAEKICKNINECIEHKNACKYKGFCQDLQEKGFFKCVECESMNMRTGLISYEPYNKYTNFDVKISGCVENDDQEDEKKGWTPNKRLVEEDSCFSSTENKQAPGRNTFDIYSGECYNCREEISEGFATIRYQDSITNKFPDGSIATEQEYLFETEPQDLFYYGGARQYCRIKSPCSSRFLNKCEQICNDDQGLTICSCDTGYKLNEIDGISCDDIDECKTEQNTDSKICQEDKFPDSQKSGSCINTIGSYICDCAAGYARNSTTNTCSPYSICDMPESISTNPSPCNPDNLKECVSTNKITYQCVCNDNFNLDYTNTNCLFSSKCEYGKFGEGVDCIRDPVNFEPIPYCTDPSKKLIQTEYTYDNQTMFSYSCDYNNNAIETVPAIVSLSGTLDYIEVIDPLCSKYIQKLEIIGPSIKRKYFAATKVRNTGMLLCGGYAIGDVKLSPLGSCEYIDIYSKSRTMLPVKARTTHSALLLDNTETDIIREDGLNIKIKLIGGRQIDSFPTNLVWSGTASSLSLDETFKLPLPLMAHQCLYNEYGLVRPTYKIICTGGWTLDDSQGLKHLRFSKKTLFHNNRKWEYGPDMNVFRMKHIQISTPKGMIILGGYNYDVGVLDSVEMLKKVDLNSINSETSSSAYVSHGFGRYQWVILDIEKNGYKISISDFGFSAVAFSHFRKDKSLSNQNFKSQTSIYVRGGKNNKRRTLLLSLEEKDNDYTSRQNYESYLRVMHDTEVYISKNDIAQWARSGGNQF